jgi:hypothetical protein
MNPLTSDALVFSDNAVGIAAMGGDPEPMMME